MRERVNFFLRPRFLRYRQRGHSPPPNSISAPCNANSIHGLFIIPSKGLICKSIENLFQYLKFILSKSTFPLFLLYIYKTEICEWRSRDSSRGILTYLFPRSGSICVGGELLKSRFRCSRKVGEIILPRKTVQFMGLACDAVYSCSSVSSCSWRELETLREGLTVVSRLFSSNSNFSSPWMQRGVERRVGTRKWRLKLKSFSRGRREIKGVNDVEMGIGQEFWLTRSHNG